MLETMTSLVLTFPNIDPVAINVFGLKIHWYAIMYLLGFAAGYLLMRRRLHHEPFRSISTPKAWVAADIEDVLLAAVAGVIVGGRLGYVLFYKPLDYLADPLAVFRLWDGGMSFHGGAIGVVLALAIYAWRAGRPFLQVADFLVPAAPLGLAFGRIGNFINGELWGRQAPADLPWAMIFPTGGDVPRHPSQLYQALLEGLLLFVLLWLYARKARYRGQVTAVFLIGYGAFRFIAEFWREPDSYLGFLSLGWSMGQWLSAPMVVVGLVLWLWCRGREISDVETTGSSLEAEAVENEEESVENAAAGDTPTSVESDSAASALSTEPEDPATA